MKKFMAIFSLALVALLLVSCGGKETKATGYGLVHGHYVGVADVTVKKEKVTAVKFEEYYLAYHAANVEQPAEADAGLVFEVSGKFYALHYSVDGELFTSAGEELAWLNSKGVNLETWVKDEANAKKYVEAVKAGKVFVADASGKKATSLKVTGNAAVDMTKSVSGYGGTVWDWKAAMKGVEDIIVGSKLDQKYELKTVTEGNKEVKKWVVDGVTTSATLVDFADYYAVAKRAYASATK